jgi:hypothetical protein
MVRQKPLRAISGAFYYQNLYQGLSGKASFSISLFLLSQVSTSPITSEVLPCDLSRLAVCSSSLSARRPTVAPLGKGCAPIICFLYSGGI